MRFYMDLLGQVSLLHLFHGMNDFEQGPRNGGGKGNGADDPEEDQGKGQEGPCEPGCGYFPVHSVKGETHGKAAEIDLFRLQGNLYGKEMADSRQDDIVLSLSRDLFPHLLHNGRPGSCGVTAENGP